MTSDDTVMTYTDFFGMRHKVHLDASEMMSRGMKATCACGKVWEGLEDVAAVYEVLKAHVTPVA